MILVDTNVLVSLVNERDKGHKRAHKDLKALARRRRPFAVPSAVLTEATHLVVSAHERQRLFLLLDSLQMQPLELEPPFWHELFRWLDDYSEHEPDACDGMLVLLASRHSTPIWTYDSEFRHIWRGLDGKPLKLVV